MNQNRVLWIFGLAALLQVLLSSYDFYGISLNVLWIALIILSNSIKQSWLVLVSVLVGYANGLISDDSVYLSSLVGLLSGVALTFMSQTKYWSLKWCRLVGLIIFVLLYDIGQILANSIELSTYIFVLMSYHLLVSGTLGALILWASDEEEYA